MNKVDISKEKILRVSSALLQEGKSESLNMRTLASLCGVSVGSIYNYFPTKAALEIAVVEELWHRVFQSELWTINPESGFVEAVSLMLERICASRQENLKLFLAHQKMIGKSGRAFGKDAMEHYFRQLKDSLLSSLLSDKDVSPQAFSETFTPQALVDYVFGCMLSSLGGADSGGDILPQLLEKALYH
ncbi:MAG: TetR/AcrR family transcriptional regulator [Oscillospiraceae bacterium]